MWTRAVRVVVEVQEGYERPRVGHQVACGWWGHAEQGDPRWFAVDVKLKRRFARIITLETLRRHEDDALSDFILLRRGNRLSVMPVTEPEWNFILSLE